MKHLSRLFVLLATVAGLAVAQTPPAPADSPKPAPDAAKPKPPETPPDVKAFNDANRTTDPEQKLAALEKWKKDFPQSSMRSAAEGAILSTLIKKYPDQHARILSQAKTMYLQAEAKQKGSTANNIANQLSDSGLLLNEARGYAGKGVRAMKEASYIQEQKAAAAKRKQANPPTDEELRKRFRESRATRIATLGRIDVKLGRIAEGRKLLEDSYAANSDQPLVAAVLGELAAKDGNDAKAFDYLVTARLSGKAPDSAKEALLGLYRKQHNGSRDGFEEMLDAEYRKRFPNPLRLTPYVADEKRSDRVVLAEVFTGAGCPPCVGADLAFDAAAERYSRKDLAILMYHEHIPRPDPMTTTETTARFKFYDGGGVPTYVIDGKARSGGGGRDNTKETYDRFDPEIEKELDAPAEAHISIGASASGSKVKVTAVVKSVKSESNDLRVQVALAEKELRYTGENGVRFHPMVVRALGGPKGEGFPLTASGTGATFEQSFDLDEISSAIKEHLDDYESKGHRGESFKFSEKKYEIAHDNLAVVVFVQDGKTKHVLQAGFVDLSSPKDHRATELQ